MILLTMSKSLILVILLSILFLIAGGITFMPLFKWSIPKIDNVNYNVYQPGIDIKKLLIYSFTLSLVPVTSFLIWKKRNVLSVQKKSAVFLIILLFIAAGIFIHRLFLYYHLTDLKNKTSDLSPSPTEFSVSLSIVKPEIYAFLGLTSGVIAVYFLYRNKLILSDES